PVLELARETAAAALGALGTGVSPPFVLVAGLVGDTRQAVHEAGVAASLGYHAGLLSLAALGGASDHELIAHCRAVAEVLPLFGLARSAVASDRPLGTDWLSLAAAMTDANGALFDPRNGFAGCLPGIHEVLRRQGLLRGTWTLDPHERLSPGQSEEIDRVLRS